MSELYDGDLQLLALKTSKVGIYRVRLSNLIQKRMANNPKRHDISVIQESIKVYGWHFPVIFDSQLTDQGGDDGAIIKGNGSTEALHGLYQQWLRGDADVPEHILASDGDWWVPVQFGSNCSTKEEAIQLSTADNIVPLISAGFDTARALAMFDRGMLTAQIEEVGMPKLEALQGETFEDDFSRSSRYTIPDLAMDEEDGDDEEQVIEWEPDLEEEEEYVPAPGDGDVMGPVRERKEVILSINVYIPDRRKWMDILGSTELSQAELFEQLIQRA